ncbi:MAG TPA: RIO1 family regulatory kinase/ATPase [Kofleriaceae bacterium]
MSDSLDVLLADGVIDEVLGRIKSGKEATISMVRRGDAVLAAKVYKDRATRSFKNNVQYKEGRKVRNTRTQRAMDSGGKFGRDSAEQAWKSAEADALYRLVDSGVRTPAPVMFYEGVLLMELVLDATGRPAPRLEEITLERDAVLGVYADLVAQLIALLCCDLVHGDLSPYNILLAADGPTIIDFPQVISAAHNTRAEHFFLRDFENVHSHLASQDPALLPHRADGRAIWQAYVRRDLTPQFVPPPPPPLQPRRNERRFDGPRQGGQQFNGPRPNDGRSNAQRPNDGRFDGPRPNNGQFGGARPNQGRFDGPRPNNGRFDGPRPNDGRFGQRPNDGRNDGRFNAPPTSLVDAPAEPPPERSRDDDYKASPPRPQSEIVVAPKPFKPPKSTELYSKWTGKDTNPPPPPSIRSNGRSRRDNSRAGWRPNDQRSHQPRDGAGPRSSNQQPQMTQRPDDQRTQSNQRPQSDQRPQFDQRSQMNQRPPNDQRSQTNQRPQGDYRPPVASSSASGTRPASPDGASAGSGQRRRRRQR